ncbi:hypothetical protein BD408DRAFT_345276 [Parasitella parasitica]|nr:hypothetical protein BD408DRAFT_345276 [Parasitella parasitica]
MDTFDDPQTTQTTSGTPAEPAPTLCEATIPTNSQTASDPVIQQLLQTVELLQRELAATRQELADLKRQQLPVANLPATHTPTFASQPAHPAGTTNPWNQPDRIANVTESLFAEKERERKRQQRYETSARMLQYPSSNQGYEHVYIPTKVRLPVGKLRTLLRRLGISNGRIIDIHYPVRNIAGILVHKDFVDDFKNTLIKRGGRVIEDFDPRSGTTIQDPKYADYTENQRDQIASYVHQSRLEKSLRHIREPVKFSVARYFYQQCWISKPIFDEIMATRSPMPEAIFGQDATITQTLEPRSSITFEFDADGLLIMPDAPDQMDSQ